VVGGFAQMRERTGKFTAIYIHSSFIYLSLSLSPSYFFGLASNPKIQFLDASDPFHKPTTDKFGG
jgi:hypothetical protein